MVIRHGQASFGADDYDALSELGHKQAKVTGDYLRSQGWIPDRLMCGTLKRQRDTLTGFGFDGAIEEHPGFNEYDFHNILDAKFGGKAPDTVMQDRKTHFRTLRDTVLEWQKDKIDGVAETWGDFTNRVQAARDSAIQHGPKRVLVAASGGVIGQLVASTLQAPDVMMMDLNLQVKNASIHRFVFSKGRIMLTEFNATPQFDTLPDLVSYS